MHASVRYCVGCTSTHGSESWYYRHSPAGERQFLCEVRFKELPGMEQARWLSFGSPGRN